MKRPIAALSAVLFVAAMVPAMASPPSSHDVPRTEREAVAMWSGDGFERTRVRGLDVVYARPVPGRPPYSRVLINPVSVTFRRNWERTAGIPLGSRIASGEIDKIRADLAEEVREQMAKEFARSGLVLTREPGPDVLAVDVDVVELYLNGPDLRTARMTQTYANGFGELTMVVALSDAASGEPLMRILDHVAGWDHGTPEPASQIDNVAEVGMAASRLAHTLGREIAAR